MTVSYEDVAATLSREVREAIERELPCRRGLTHLWDHERVEICGWRGVVRIDEWWRCIYCGIDQRHDPRPVDSWARRQDRYIVTESVLP